jgi:hypothetical protein
MAKITAQPMKDILFLNLIYEMFVQSHKDALFLIYSYPFGCTSIVAQTDDGSIFHGQNLDWPIPALHRHTVQIDFFKGGEVNCIFVCMTSCTS